MCFTCYFRFIGVYLLLNNEPEGNGNLNRLKSWSQYHQKLPVLYWCSVTTLFAYSAGQMCLLQHFGWNPNSHLHRAGFSSRELSACRQMWGRRLSLCPAAQQGCAYMSPQSSEDVLSDRWHIAESSPRYPDQSWPFWWCQPGQHSVSCREPLWCSGSMQKIRSWPRHSSRWC